MYKSLITLALVLTAGLLILVVWPIIASFGELMTAIVIETTNKTINAIVNFMELVIEMTANLITLAVIALVVLFVLMSISMSD